MAEVCSTYRNLQMYIPEDLSCTSILRQVAPENIFDKINVGANRLKQDIASLNINTAPAANS